MPRYGDLQFHDPYFGPEDHATFTQEKATSDRFDRARARVRGKFLALHDVLHD